MTSPSPPDDRHAAARSLVAAAAPHAADHPAERSSIGSIGVLDHREAPRWRMVARALEVQPDEPLSQHERAAVRLGGYALTAAITVARGGAWVAVGSTATALGLHALGLLAPAQPSETAEPISEPAEPRLAPATTPAPAPGDAADACEAAKLAADAACENFGDYCRRWPDRCSPAPIQPE